MFALAFLKKALELVAGDGVPAAGMQAHEEDGVGGILNAAGVSVDIVFGVEDGGGNWEHGVFDTEDGFFAVLFERGQDEAVLSREQVEDGNALQAARDKVREGVGDDDWDDDLVVAADLEDHEDGSHGDTEKSGEEDAHADQDVGSGGSGEMGEEDALDVADGAAEHGSDEERGREHAAGSSADERDRGGDNFENCEDGEDFPGVLAVHGLVHGIVTSAHDLGSAEESDESDEESGECRLKVLRPARQGFEAGTQIADRLGKGYRGQAADNAEDRVGDEFSGTLEGGDGNAEERFAAEKPADDHDAGDSGEDDGAEDAGAPASDDLFDDEEDGGDGSVESGGEAGGSADWSHEAEFFAGDFQPASESGGDAGSDLERGIFGAEGLAGADGDRGADEFSDSRAKGDDTVEDVERGLGLVDAAAADAGEDDGSRERRRPGPRALGLQTGANRGFAGADRARARCIQSMARRKQTTARPEKIPMKTERMRKNTSSLKTPSRVENKRREMRSRTDGGWRRENFGAGGEDRSLAGGLAFLGDQEQCEVEALRLAARRGGLLFDLEDNVHDGIREIGFRGRAEMGEIWFGGGPAGLQAGKRGRGEGSSGFEIDACLLGTFGEALFGLVEGGGDAAVAFGVGDVALERIGAEDEVGWCEELARS